MRGALPKDRSLRIATLSALVLGFVIVSTGIIAALFPATAAASTSSLEVLDGVVALSHDGQSFTQGEDGDLVEQGDVVRTGEASHAVLTFFDGSTIEVEPESELIVHTLMATSAGDIVMEMQQNLGRSWHVVSRALTPNSKYEVRTPTTTASVRGTAFLVAVEPTGRTNVQTTDGLVRASGGGVMVEIPPGFQTDVEPGGTPDAPTPAPPPPALVKVILDPTPNAAVTDANGRTVGVINGLPIRYVPGSTITIVDGKLVLTIPNPTLGRIDTHVQPADPRATSVDVQVIVQVGDTVVGNVVEQRTIDSKGIAKGGVLITDTGTYVLPDDEVKKAPDPRIGRLPPPPPAGFSLPFIAKTTPAPTPIVTPAPSFVPRFDFDPRLVAVATATPPPPTATPRPTFAGGFQPYTETTTLSSATPAPNSGLQVFSGSDATLTKLVAPSPTPTPTLSTKLITPILLVTSTPTPTPSLVLRTISPILLIAVTPSPSPTGTTLILRTITPIFLLTPSPTPAPTTLILRTLDPIFILPTPSPTPAPTLIIATVPPIFFTAAPTPTPLPTLQVIPSFILPTIAPTPTPTAPPIFQTIGPLPSLIILPTVAPTPTPTFIIRTIAPTFIISTPSPTPAPTAPPIFFTQPPIIILPTPTPTPTLAPLPTLSCRLFGCG